MWMWTWQTSWGSNSASDPCHASPCHAEGGSVARSPDNCYGCATQVDPPASGTQYGAVVSGGIGDIDGGGRSTPSGPVVAATGPGCTALLEDDTGAAAGVLDDGAATLLGVAVAVVGVLVGVAVGVVASVVDGLDDGALTPVAAGCWIAGAGGGCFVGVATISTVAIPAIPAATAEAVTASARFTGHRPCERTCRSTSRHRARRRSLHRLSTSATKRRRSQLPDPRPP